MRTPRQSLYLVFTLTALMGCQSPAQHVASADEEVYALITARRAALADAPELFELAEAPGSLRQRLLAGEPAPVEPIGLRECLGIAAESNRAFQDNRESLYLSALDLTMERYLLGWIPAGSLAYGLEGTDNQIDRRDGSFGLNFSRLLGDGGKLVAGIGINTFRWLTVGNDHGVTDWSTDGLLSLSFTQPLLSGAGRKIVLEPLTQAERDLVYQVRSYERYRRTFAVEVASRFYQVLQQMDAANNANLNYENLKVIAERNRELAAAGRLDDLQLDQVRQDELRSQNNLLTARAQLESTLDGFKLFLGLPVAVELSFDSRELTLLSEDEPTELDLDEELVIDVAMRSRLDYLTSLDRLEDAERRVTITEDALRAGLDLVASSNTGSTNGRPSEFDLRDSSWGIGLSFDLPLDRLPERNAYRSSLISRDATRRSLEEFRDSMRVSLRGALRDTVIAVLSFKIQRESVVLAERRAESTRLRLDAGRADTRDILEAEEALLDSRNAATNSLVDYQLAVLALYRDTEQLEVGEEGISLTPILQPVISSTPSGETALGQ
jgi:outer membrane protein TolC